MRSLTMSSVKKRLISDVPIGSFLSGGLDSSVIAFCAKQFKPDLKTYSIGFKDEPVFDETRYAEQMARYIKSDHTSFILTNEDVLEPPLLLKKALEKLNLPPDFLFTPKPGEINSL